MATGNRTWTLILRTAKLAAPLIILAALVLAAFYRCGSNNVRAMFAKDAQDELLMLTGGIELSLKHTLTDLKFLASFRNDPVMLANGDLGCQSAFQRFMESKPQYFRLRHLKPDGQELFRIDRLDMLPDDQTVQTINDASSLGHLPDAANLPLGSVLVSPINGEGGPRKADFSSMYGLSYAIPFHDDNNRVASILLLDSAENDIDSIFGRKMHEEDYLEALLLNGEGTILKGCLGKQDSDCKTPASPASFAKLHPEEWARIQSENNGLLHSSTGIYAFGTIRPEKIFQHTAAGSIPPAEVWKVVARVPAVVMAKITHSTAMNMLTFFIPLSIILICGSSMLVLTQEKNCQAQQVILDQHVSSERFVPKEMLDLMGKENLRDVQLSQSVEREMTVLFSDIRSYTQLSESLPPHEVFKMLNSYFSRIDTAISGRKGFIDKYIGDAVMALFPGATDDALRAAIAMRNRVDQFNLRQIQNGKPVVHTGFGLHFGEVALGSMGTARRMQTTAIGDTVNIAARLESATKAFKTDIIISDTVHDRLQHPEMFRLRKIDTVRVKGKERPVVLYEAYDADDGDMARKKDESREDFAKALELYEKGEFDLALEFFNKYADKCPEDSIPPIYIKRCNTMKRMNPGNDWAGISTL